MGQGAKDSGSTIPGHGGILQASKLIEGVEIDHALGVKTWGETEFGDERNRQEAGLEQPVHYVGFA
jgi:hypothetical protein